MQYVIYLRKSRADLETEASGGGETLARHERALIELAGRLNLNIAAVYKEVVSGESIALRPVMQRLLSEIESGIWGGVLVMEIDRLARGATIDQGIIAQTFKYSNTKIITPLKTYDPNNEYDEEFFEFSLFMSRREYKAITRRMQRGRLASVKEGKYVGNKPPFGYKRKKLENDRGFTLEPHPEESEIVKLIFALYAYGERQEDNTFKRLGVSLISRRLNNMKISPRQSETWVPATIRDILINPVYIGKVRWNWRPAVKKKSEGAASIRRPRSSLENCIVANGLHDKIIDMETWELVQAYIKQNPPHPGPSHLSLKNPLSGLIICGKCGRRMVRRPHASKQPDTLMCPAASCGNISSRLSLVEENVLLALEKWLCEYDVTIGNGEKLNNNRTLAGFMEKALKRLDEEIKTIETQISGLYDLLERGAYSTDVFLERSQLLTQRLKTALHDKETLSDEIIFEKSRIKTQVALTHKTRKITAIYAEESNPKIKNDLLKEILEKVIYVKSKNNFSIELYPRLPE